VTRESVKLDNKGLYNVWCIYSHEVKKRHIILGDKYQGKILLVFLRPSHRWMDNIEVNVNQIQSNGTDNDRLRIECMVAFCEYCKSDEILHCVEIKYFLAS
jgi:hypothetical protein